MFNYFLHRIYKEQVQEDPLHEEPEQLQEQPVGLTEQLTVQEALLHEDEQSQEQPVVPHEEREQLQEQEVPAFNPAPINSAFADFIKS